MYTYIYYNILWYGRGDVTGLYLMASWSPFLGSQLLIDIFFGG